MVNLWSGYPVLVGCCFPLRQKRIHETTRTERTPGARKTPEKPFAFTHVTFDCVKLWLPLFKPFLVSPRRKLWPKRKSARTRRVRVRNRQTASTAVHHVKALETPSNSIVIAATKTVRETSKL